MYVSGSPGLGKSLKTRPAKRTTHPPHAPSSLLTPHSPLAARRSSPRSALLTSHLSASHLTPFTLTLTHTLILTLTLHSHPLALTSQLSPITLALQVRASRSGRPMTRLRH